MLSTVISRLDYCNATFAGISSEQVLRLQRILNHAARLVMKRSKRDHITPLLKELHWLPVQFRSQNKLATLAYRRFDGSLPQYLSSCLCTYEPYLTLRSSHEKLLKIPKYNLKTSLSFLAPTVWNSLPSDLRIAPSLASFKKQTKTYVIRQAFSWFCVCVCVWGGVTIFWVYVMWVCEFTDWAVCDISVYIEVNFICYVYVLKYFMSVISCGMYGVLGNFALEQLCIIIIIFFLFFVVVENLSTTMNVYFTEYLIPIPTFREVITDWPNSSIFSANTVERCYFIWYCVDLQDSF